MTLSRHLTKPERDACNKVANLNRSMTALAKKGAQLQRKDAEWLAPIPDHGWVTTREAAVIWGVSPGYAWERMDLLKASGAVWRGGTGGGRRWRKA